MNLIELISEATYRDEKEINGELIRDFYILQDSRAQLNFKITEESLDSKDFSEDNPNLTIYEDRGFKFKSYAEFFINNSVEDDIKFKIGTVEIIVSKPSILFDLLVADVGDKYYDRDSYYTISLKGINKNNLENYIYQAFFIIESYFSENVLWDFPSIQRFYGEDYGMYDPSSLDISPIDEYITDTEESSADDRIKNFDLFDNIEAISFYNAGKSMKEQELSFQYFYKVLEYFFILNKENEFVSLIADYNSSKINISSFIKKVSTIYNADEITHLELLLESLGVELEPLLRFAIESKKITSLDTNELAKGIYKYRNSLVHGKKERSLELKLPNLLSSDEEDFWIKVVHNISVILIKKYCYPNKKTPNGDVS